MINEFGGGSGPTAEELAEEYVRRGKPIPSTLKALLRRDRLSAVENRVLVHQVTSCSFEALEARNAGK